MGGWREVLVTRMLRGYPRRWDTDILKPGHYRPAGMHTLGIRFIKPGDPGRLGSTRRVAFGGHLHSGQSLECRELPARLKFGFIRGLTFRPVGPLLGGVIVGPWWPLPRLLLRWSPMTHLGAAGQRLLDDRMLNVVLVLVLATAILGPMLTEHFASRLIIGARRWHRLDRARRRVLAGAAGGRLVDLCRGRRLVSRLCRLRSRLDWHPPLARCGPAPCLNGTLSGGIRKKPATKVP